MAKNIPTHIIIEIDVAEKYLEYLKIKLEMYKGTLCSKEHIEGLIEAYVAILLNKRICLPDKQFL